MKVAEKHNPNRWIYYDVKSTLTEIETLTSTLHHNKFNNLDFIFLLPSYCRIFIHIYFHTVFSEKQIPKTILHDI